MPALGEFIGRARHYGYTKHTIRRAGLARDSSRRGLATMQARYIARETATFSRLAACVAWRDRFRHSGCGGSSLAAEIAWRDGLEELRHPSPRRRAGWHGRNRRGSLRLRGRLDLAKSVFPRGPGSEQADVHTPSAGKGLRAWLLASGERHLPHGDRSHLA